MPTHGSVENREGLKVYILVLGAEDHAQSQEVCDRLVAMDADWTEAEHTRVENVDEIVVMATAALHVGDAVEEYEALFDDGEVDAMEVHNGPLRDGTSPVVCAQILRAQYGNGRDYDANDLNVAVEEAKRLAAPAPRP